MGRWINRDPIEEEGFYLQTGWGLLNVLFSLKGYAVTRRNLYNFVLNNSINNIDYLGLTDSVTASFKQALARGNWEAARMIVECSHWSSSAKAAALALISKHQKIAHIFGKGNEVIHRMKPLLDKFNGNKVAAYDALQKTTQKLVDQGGISAGQLNKGVDITVKGVRVTVRGNIIEGGKAKIGTAFIGPKPQ